MTGFQTRILWGALALTVLSAVPVVPACAQWTSDKPPVLKPSDYPPEATEDPPDPKYTKLKKADKDAAESPHALGKPNTLSPVPQNAPAGPVVARPAPVQVDALGTAEGLPLGTLDSTNGGFSDQLWSGSERARIDTLLKKAPLASADTVLRDLDRRVILTKALPPPGTAKRAFAALRIEKLLDAGFLTEAGAMAAAADIPKDEDFAKVQARAILYANRKQDVCGKPTEMRLSGGDAFWLQLRMMCARLSGDTATAELTGEILKAQGHNDPGFDSLLEQLGSKKPLPPGAIKQPSAIHVFLLQQEGLPVTETVARKLGTAANLLVVRDHRNPARARFEAAERVVLTGALSATELRALAEEQDLPLARVANAATEAPKLPYYMGQVLLRRAIAVETKPEAKAEFIALALSLGEKNGALALTALMQGDVIAAAKPTPATAAYARPLAQALILSRRYEAASVWAANDPVLRTIIALGSQDATRLAAAQQDLTGFGRSLTANPQSADADRSYKALILGLADVLGVNLPPDAKNAAATASAQHWPGMRPDAAVMTGLEEAAQHPEERGEAILLLTGEIHRIGLKDMAPDATIALVRLLAAINEPKAARALALQALAQYTPPNTP